MVEKQWHQVSKLCPLPHFLGNGRDNRISSTRELTVFESKELENAVYNGNHNGQCKEVWVGFQQSNLGGKRTRKEHSLMHLVDHCEI